MTALAEIAYGLVVQVLSDSISEGVHDHASTVAEVQAAVDSCRSHVVFAADLAGQYPGLHTPLVWIEILLLIQDLAIGMVIGPVTAALISDLPLEQAGAGSAVTNIVRQTGSVIGIAVGGTIAYRRAIEPSLEGAPGPVQDQA